MLVDSKKFIILLFIVFLFSNNLSFANLSKDKLDNSCITEPSDKAKILELASDPTIAWFSRFFHMKDYSHNGEKSETTESCQIPSDKVKWCFNGLNDTYCDEKGEGFQTWYAPSFVDPVYLRVVNKGDKVCVQLKFAVSLFGYVDIGCKYRADPTTVTLRKNCYISNSCYNFTYSNSKSVLPLASIVIQCVRDSLNNIFLDKSVCTNKSINAMNFFVSFQNGMRNLVKILLTLYVILFGIKIILGKEIPSKAEIIIFLFKFILVLYFSVGITDGVVNSDGKIVYDDGLNKYVRPFFENLSLSLSNIVINAGGNETLCSYNPDEYQKGYGYLAMWDALDCRLSYYLGFDLGSTLEKGGLAIGNILFGAIIRTFFPVIALIIDALTSMNMLFASLLGIFGLLLFSVTLMFVHLFIVSMIGVAVLTFIAPIIVPLALFDVTKAMFSGWLRLFFSFALQPVIIAAFMSLMLNVFDNLMFGTCEFNDKRMNFHSMLVQPIETFTGSSVGAESNKEFFRSDGQSLSRLILSFFNKDIIYYSIKESKDPECYTTFGYQIRQEDHFKNMVTRSFSLFRFLNPTIFSKLITTLVGLVFFGYLFYTFASKIGYLAGDLMGITALSDYAISGTSAFDRIMSAAKAAALAAIAAVKLATKNYKGAALTALGAVRSGAKVMQDEDAYKKGQNTDIGVDQGKNAINTGSEAAKKGSSVGGKVAETGGKVAETGGKVADVVSKKI